jgi:ASC-1-like (ASCH) protein
MNKYYNHRPEPWFGYLKSGQKTIEGRLKRGKYAKIKPGDRIKVCNKDESDEVEVRVIGIREYPSFQEMLTAEPVEKILPDVSRVEDGLAVYRKFYNEDEEKECGVIAIEVLP